jgi:hypothetical protein
MSDQERPVLGWIQDYQDGRITFGELKQRVANHEFRPREPRTERDRMLAAYNGDDGGIDPGTLDDLVYGAFRLKRAEYRALMNVARVPAEELRTRVR